MTSRLGPRPAAVAATGLALGAALLSPLPATATGTDRQAAGAERPSAGSAGVGDPLFPKAGNGGYRVGHYDLRLKYAPQRRMLRATATISARTTKALSSFHLDLYGLRVDRIVVDGEVARWKRRGQELVVRPDGPLAADAAFTTRVRYHGSPRTYIDPDGSRDGWSYTDDGAVVASEPVGAMTVFPANNHPSDKARFDVAITVPDHLKAVSNGILTGRRSSQGRTTWRWHEPDQMATYLMTATIGRFRMLRDRGPGGLPIWSFIDPRTSGAKAIAQRIPAVLRRLEKWYGDYPFVSSGVIVDRSRLGYALEVQTRPLFDGTPDMSTLVHELAHQWYGDAVSPRTWQHIWLNEGFATYTEWLWAARRHPGAAQARFDRLYREPAGSSLWSPPPADPGSAANLFGRPVYDRGAMAMHALRKQVGWSTFLRISRRWAQVHDGGSARTSQLRTLAERVSGQPLGRLFSDWVWLDGKPDGY
jgi:aminopeptidase N